MDLLESLIGREAVIEEKAVRIIEILVSDCCVVLQQTDAHFHLQEDQFGQVSRPSARTWTVPIFSEVEPGEIHPVMRQLLSEEEIKQLCRR